MRFFLYKKYEIGVKPSLIWPLHTWVLWGLGTQKISSFVLWRWSSN
jgi:hypothetical protein